MLARGITVRAVPQSPISYVGWHPDMHRDNFPLHIKVQIYVNDVGEERGAFAYVPGSHKEGAGPYPPREAAGCDAGVQAAAGKGRDGCDLQLLRVAYVADQSHDDTPQIAHQQLLCLQRIARRPIQRARPGMDAATRASKEAPIATTARYPEAAQVHMVPFLLEAFPQVRVVFKHMMVCPGKGRVTWKDGQPHIEVQKPSVTRHTTAEFYQFENVYALMSGAYAMSDEPYPYKDLQGWHTPEPFVGRYGSDHTLWGSDFPFTMKNPGYGKTAELMATLMPDSPERDLDNAMGATARRILRFKEACII